MVKAVLTDLDGVVRRWDPGIMHQAESTAGLPPGALPNTAFEPDLLLHATTGQIDDESWRSEVAERLRLRYPTADGREAVRLWSRSPGEIDTDVLDLLLRCRDSASLVLITNATTKLDSDLKRLGIGPAFDHVVNSSSIGLVKPQPGIFNTALELLGIKADEAFFIDDRAENVNAAAELGMGGHHYTTIGRLKRALELHGLPV
ncbi:MAG: HAD family phosphatase [Gemmatimonadetes bacterium]|nr:HAD family phosphatase [Gemmatimonadota bacterium]MYG83855.1 HAD family phosphatase [Gemmatimonadota bacterium]MYJ90686.1 HAD family phosphatase [Gemmatimonadota bacterium]